MTPAQWSPANLVLAARWRERHHQWGMSMTKPERAPHQTKPVQVWIDIDINIASLVEDLNTIPNVRTLASCQGTLGEGGPDPYKGYVMVTWITETALNRLYQDFDFVTEGHCGYVYGRKSVGESVGGSVAEMRTIPAQSRVGFTRRD